jgi:hypothetical protein
MKYIATACALTATTTLLAACGAGQRTSRSSAPGSSTASAGAATLARLSRQGSAEPHPARAEALAFGRAVNLVAADIPGAKISRKKKRKSSSNEDLHCEGPAGRGRKLAEVGSPRLTRGTELETEEISSHVTVRPDARAAANDLAWLRVSGAPECIARALSRRFGGRTISEGHWGRFTASSLPAQVPGAAGTIAFRISTTLSFPVSEVSVPIYFDVFGFTSGPAEVALFAASATQPVPAATEQRLLSLLLVRALAHPL